MPLGRRVFGSSGRKIKHTHTHTHAAAGIWGVSLGSQASDLFTKSVELFEPSRVKVGGGVSHLVLALVVLILVVLILVVLVLVVLILVVLVLVVLVLVVLVLVVLVFSLQSFGTSSGWWVRCSVWHVSLMPDLVWV